LKLSLLLLLLGVPASAQLLSAFPLEDPWAGALPRTAPRVELAGWQPWSLPGCSALGLRLRSGSSFLMGELGMEAQDWGGLDHGALVLQGGVHHGGRDILLRWRGERLGDARAEALDLILRTREPLRLGLRLRLSENMASGLRARAAPEALVLAWSGQESWLGWCHQRDGQGGGENWLLLGREAGDWELLLILGSGPWQGLDLHRRRGKMGLVLRTRWHPWLGLSPGLVLEWHGAAD